MKKLKLVSLLGGWVVFEVYAPAISFYQLDVTFQEEKCLKNIGDLLVLDGSTGAEASLSPSAMSALIELNVRQSTGVM